MNFITDNWQAITGVLGSVIAFFGGRKMKHTQHKNSEATALQNMQKTYDKWTSDTNKRIQGLQDELTTIKNENIEQRKEMRSLQRDNRSLHNQITALTVENNELKKIVSELQIENEKLRAK